MERQQRAQEALQRLKKRFSQKRGPFVVWSNPLELVVATVLSAQCTDERVNKVTKKLFKKYKTAQDYARASLRHLEKDIYSAGFYKIKAKYLKSIGVLLATKYGGRVPDQLDQLCALPGVSYKTAYLVMAKAFGKHAGIAVDTHVRRVAPRLGLTAHVKPEKISKDLETLYPKEDYLNVNELFIMHGRATCTPRPQCFQCPLNDICPSAEK